MKRLTKLACALAVLSAQTSTLHRLDAAGPAATDALDADESDRAGGFSASSRGLVILSPLDGQVVGGRTLVWAASPERRASPHSASPGPELAFSRNGTDYDESRVPLPGAADFGDDSTTTSLDLGGISGPLYVRARFQGEEVVHTVNVDQLPQVDCVVQGFGVVANFNCAASADPDGSIVQYQWQFGDSTAETSAQPFVSHAYPGPGQYDVDVSACDDQGLCDGRAYSLLILDPLTFLLQERQGCGCEQMLVHKTGDSKLGDPRHKDDRGTDDPKDDGYAPSPLGPDGKFLTFNFEIQALLKAGGTAAACKEGQEVKATRKEGAVVTHKKACTAGTELPRCDKDADCNTWSCRGGKKGGQPCLDKTMTTTEAAQAAQKACTDGGGKCQPDGGTGKCTPFPCAGKRRGNDDYRTEVSPIKEYEKQGIRWLDYPGWNLEHDAEGADKVHKLEADFLAFVEGSGDGKGMDCKCHLKLVLEWNGKKYLDTTKLTLVEDRENVRCKLAP